MKKYPNYIFTTDGFIGCFAGLDFGEFPIYRFEGGSLIADNAEIERGCNTYEEAKEAYEAYRRSH